MQFELVFPDRYTPSLLILKERLIDHTFYHFVTHALTSLLWFSRSDVILVDCIEH